MRENVGRVDRIVRSIVGPSLMGLGIAGLARGRMLGVGGVILGTMILESAISRVCPVSAAFGIDTRSEAEKIRDFRADVNEQSDRVSAEYGKPIGIDETPVVAVPDRA